MNFFTKKIISTSLIVVLIIPLSFSVFIPTAYAIPGGGGGGAAAAGILSCAAGGISIGAGVGAAAAVISVPTLDLANLTINSTGVAKECIFDGLAVVIREVLIASLTRSIVNWINNGFDGEPAFITDLEGFMLDVGDQVLGTYIVGAGLALLCSPFNIDVRIALALDYYSSSRDQVSCTLTGVIQNVEDAFGDFSSGNMWDQWLQFSINPNNNAYGSFLSARQDIRLSVSNAQGTQLEVIGWGSGFMSFEICDDYLPATATNNPSIANAAPIRKCKIGTPGSVINEQLNVTLGSGFRQLELADEINEIIGALLGQLMNQVLSPDGGISGLSSGSNGQPAYVDQLIQESEDNAEEEFRDYGIGAIIGHINIANQYISVKNASLAKLNESENLLASLSGCYASKLSTLQSPTLTSRERTTAVSRMNSASSTIAASITPLQNLILSNIELAQNNISQLLVIEENLSNTTSQSEVNTVLEDELEPLIESEIVHSRIDLFVAQQQREDIGDITEAMNTTTNTDLATCERFPVRIENRN